MKRTFLLCILFTIVICGCKDIKKTILRLKEPQGKEFSVKHMRFEGSSKYQNAEARLTLDMDYPEGESMAAFILRSRLYEMLMGESITEDIKDGQVFFDRLLAKYKKENSPENIRDMLEEGIGTEWAENIRFKKEWENEHIVSFTLSVDAFNVGNATSSAWIKDITMRKDSGWILGWEMFKSQKKVKAAIDEMLITKYGREGADLYDNGIPMPEDPLFLANGVRFDYGDYSIVTPHVYEETGEYPCCLLTYDMYKDLLTDEACSLLGLE